MVHDYSLVMIHLCPVTRLSWIVQYLYYPGTKNDLVHLSRKYKFVLNSVITRLQCLGLPKRMFVEFANEVSVVLLRTFGDSATLAEPAAGSI